MVNKKYLQHTYLLLSPHAGPSFLTERKYSQKKQMSDRKGLSQLLLPEGNEQRARGRGGSDKAAMVIT